MTAPIGIGLGILAAGCASGVEVKSPAIEASVQKHFPQGSKGGLAVLVIKDKVVIHSKGYGLKNGQEPITPQTRMGLASVTKQFAAMCAAMLIEEGKLSLTDKVSKHLPDIRLPKKGRELLVQDLVWHVNGLANFISGKDREKMEGFKKQPSVCGGSLRSGLLKNAAELPAPAGVGYYLAHPTRGSNFGDDRLVFGLMMLGAHLEETWGDHPYHRLCVRDMSSKAGGKIKYHINHQMGLDADLTFFATDLPGNAVSSVYTSYGADGKSSKGDHRFDTVRNWEVIEGILKNEFFGEIRAILVSDPLKQRLLRHANEELKRLTSGQKTERAELKDLIKESQQLMRQPSSSPHDNHFHLSLKL